MYTKNPNINKFALGFLVESFDNFLVSWRKLAFYNLHTLSFTRINLRSIAPIIVCLLKKFNPLFHENVKGDQNISSISDEKYPEHSTISCSTLKQLHWRSL